MCARGRRAVAAHGVCGGHKVNLGHLFGSFAHFRSEYLDTLTLNSELVKDADRCRCLDEWMNGLHHSVRFFELMRHASRGGFLTEPCRVAWCVVAFFGRRSIFHFQFSGTASDDAGLGKRRSGIAVRDSTRWPLFWRKSLRRSCGLATGRPAKKTRVTPRRLTH